MRKYELMVIMKKDFPHEDEKQQREIVEKLLHEQPVTDLKTSDFGKRELAYEIQKEKEGCYILATFSAETINVGRIETEIKLMNNVLRYLLTSIE